MASPKGEKIIGIDLGTTNSVVAVMVYYVGIIFDEDRQIGKELSIEESREICSEESSLT